MLQLNEEKNAETKSSATTILKQRIYEQVSYEQRSHEQNSHEQQSMTTRQTNEANGHTNASLMSQQEIDMACSAIGGLSNEQYAEQLLQPVDNLSRPSAWQLVKKIATSVFFEEERGPLILARVSLQKTSPCDQTALNKPPELVSVIVQNRAIRNGVWQPEHHQHVEDWLADSANQGLPVITFIDTPGAAAGDEANLGLQAHSISSLIASFTKLSVPSIGVIVGKAYSGGAIPLASTNVLLALKDAVFNTIQPQGLAAIARKEKLSWQECAQRIGISAIELAHEGVVDGVINYSPADPIASIDALKDALIDSLNQLQSQARDGQNLRDLRWETLKSRLQFQEGEHALSPVTPAPVSIKMSDQTPIMQKDDDWQNWLARSQPIRYHKRIAHVWRKVKKAINETPTSSNARISVSLNTVETGLLEQLALEIAFECFHQWQGDFDQHLLHYKQSDAEQSNQKRLASDTELSDLRELLQIRRLKSLIILQLEYLRVLNTCYDGFLSELCPVAHEYSRHQNLSEDTVSTLWSSAQKAASEAGVHPHRCTYFLNWLYFLDQKAVLQPQLQRLSEWKQRQMPRLDKVAFVVAAYYSGTLLCRLFVSQARGLAFSGAFQPTHIGRQKDFWAKLTHASRNIRIQEELDGLKPLLAISAAQWTELLFTDFNTQDDTLITNDPKQFPGFAERIAQARVAKETPCGLITGSGLIRHPQLPENASTDKNDTHVAAFISNHSFQAGAFDMAAAEKLCRLLDYAQEQQLPVIGIVSSAGMQTKEGAAALFSMAVANEAINRFTENGGRILVIGYGDCTGGAQASFVTHPCIDTYYLSGANVPFAGQVVVPEHLTLQGTLSNYLFQQDKNRSISNSAKSPSLYRKSMKGLVRHPISNELDRRLQAIDPDIPLPNLGATELLGAWLSPISSSKVPPARSMYEKRFDPIKTLLVHARGCTALRLIQGAHAYGKQVVLVQSDPDMRSATVKHLNQNDRLVCLGGQSSDESYLNADSVLRVAQLEQVDALHPGIGFLSENADFAEGCHQQGLNFIGPTASSIARMGDKSQAIATARLANVPTVPGSQGVVSNAAQAKIVMEQIGLPLLIKASHGGGGKGIGTVFSSKDLEKTFHRVRQEAASAFGCGDVYLERLVENVRHIEVQVLRDRHSNFRMIGVRDCSTQRNRQKVIEESGEYVTSSDQIESLRSWSRQLSETIQYIGAGTVEFLYDLDRKCFYFMEMNTRLQVEHIVTEMTTNIDLVEQQLRIAEGESIADIPEHIQPHGHAIEVRVNAEAISLSPPNLDQAAQLVVEPAIGTFTKVIFPKHAYSRVLSIAEKGVEVTPFYDNLIAQIVVHGNTREQALERMQDMLSQCVIEGVATNLPLLRALLSSESFSGGHFSTHFVDEWASSQEETGPFESTGSNAEHNSLLEIDGKDYLLKLPSAGIAWVAASPDLPSFVKAGDIISTEQTLLLLEVMKMFMPVTLEQLLPKGLPATQYRVKHCRDIEGQYLQKGDVFMSLTAI